MTGDAISNMSAGARTLRGGTVVPLGPTSFRELRPLVIDARYFVNMTSLYSCQG